MAIAYSSSTLTLLLGNLKSILSVKHSRTINPQRDFFGTCLTWSGLLITGRLNNVIGSISSSSSSSSSGGGGGGSGGDGGGSISRSSSSSSSSCSSMAAVNDFTEC